MVTFEEKMVSIIRSAVTKDPFHKIKNKEKPKLYFGKYRFTFPMKMFYQFCFEKIFQWCHLSFLFELCF